MEEDTLRDEYDFTQLGEPTRGKYATHAATIRNDVVAVTLDADVARAFPTARAVNDALRLLMHVSERLRDTSDASQ